MGHLRKAAEEQAEQVKKTEIRYFLSIIIFNRI